MTTGTNENSLQVYIGNNRKIATITLPSRSETDISFTYEPNWVEEGFAVSPHLPLNGNFDHRAVRNFLQNMLPEGKGLEEITSNTTISKNNTFGLIRVIGAETSGALSFISGNPNKRKTTFREITQVELIDKLARFKASGESITYWDGQTRLSVAGVQDKLNLLEMDGKLGFGEGNLCSNKIFKIETGKAPFIAVNELFTMLLAGESGIQVPAVEIRSYGSVRVFVIERFDRRVAPEQRHVLRRHIIDGCQASNLPPSYKYERQHGYEGDGKYIRDGISFPKLFAIETTHPETYQTQLIRWMTFNLLVRNYDAHGKNISYFVGKQGLTLTQFYDLVNIEAIIREIQARKSDASGTKENSISQHYAMSIGEYASGTVGNFSNPITAYMLADMAKEFAISLPRMKLLMEQMIKSVLGAINTAKERALKQELLEAEIKHIDSCIQIIAQAARELSEEIKRIPDMEELL